MRSNFATEFMLDLDDTRWDRPPFSPATRTLNGCLLSVCSARDTGGYDYSVISTLVSGLRYDGHASTIPLAMAQAEASARKIHVGVLSAARYRLLAQGPDNYGVYQECHGAAPTSNGRLVCVGNTIDYPQIVGSRLPHNNWSILDTQTGEHITAARA